MKTFTVIILSVLSSLLACTEPPVQQGKGISMDTRLRVSEGQNRGNEDTTWHGSICSKEELVNYFLAKEDNNKEVLVQGNFFSDSLLLVKLVREKDWWESFAVVRLIDSCVKTIILPKAEDSLAASIFSLRLINLRGFNNPLIEIFDKTHVGNGSIRLYALKNETLKMVKHAIAIDQHYEQTGNSADTSYVFKDGALRSTYADLNNDMVDDLVLEGKVQCYKKRKLVSEKLVRYQFLLSNQW